jgi:hypothetical protein
MRLPHAAHSLAAMQAAVAALLLLNDSLRLAHSGCSLLLHVAAFK